MQVVKPVLTPSKVETDREHDPVHSVTSVQFCTTHTLSLQKTCVSTQLKQSSAALPSNTHGIKQRTRNRKLFIVLSVGKLVRKTTHINLYRRKQFVRNSLIQYQWYLSGAITNLIKNTADASLACVPNSYSVTSRVWRLLQRTVPVNNLLTEWLCGPRPKTWSFQLISFGF